MSDNNVKVIKEAIKCSEGSWRLCFQYCEYQYSNGSSEKGYRFIWRRPNGNLQAARGQARIPSLDDIMELTSITLKESWGCYNCD